MCVAVNIRPLIDIELSEGCQECLYVTPGQPQVRDRPLARPPRHAAAQSTLPMQPIFDCVEIGCRVWVATGSCGFRYAGVLKRLFA